MELQGIQCFDLGEEPEDKDRIMTSRMLTPPITKKDEVLAALMHHLETSARKLRRQNSYARKMFVFFMTSQHDNYRRPRDVRSLEIRFPSSLKTTAEMIPYLKMMVDAMWPDYRQGHDHFLSHQCGVTLGEISPDDA